MVSSTLPYWGIIGRVLAIFGTVVCTDIVSFLLRHLRVSILAPALAKFRHPMEEVCKPALGGGRQVLGLFTSIGLDLRSLFSL